MIGRRLPASVLSCLLLVLSACSSGPSASPEPRPLPADAGTVDAPAGSARDDSEPAPIRSTGRVVPDRDLATVLPLVYSLDPCRLVAAAGARPVLVGQHGCRADTTTGGPGIQVWLVLKLDAAARFRAHRRVVNGVLTYYQRPFVASYCGTTYLPFSQRYAIGVTVPGNRAEHCQHLAGAVERITRRLARRPASLQSRRPGPQNLSPCAVLATVRAPAAGELVVPQGSSGEGLCAFAPPGWEDRWGSVASMAVQARTVAHTGGLATASLDTTPRSCEVTGPGWPMAGRDTGADQVQLRLTARGSCQQARAWFGAYTEAMRTARPRLPRLDAEHRFWYTAAENDSAQWGTCRDVRLVAGMDCRAVTPAALPPADEVIADSAQDPDVLCAVVRDAVGQHFAELHQMNTVRVDAAVGPLRDPAGTASRCVFTEPTHQLQLTVWSDPTAPDGFEEVDGLLLERGGRQGAGSSSDQVGRAGEGALLFELTAGPYVDAEAVARLLRPMTHQIGRERLS